MRDAAGQLADGLHLLRLAEPLLEEMLARHVANGPDHSLGRAVRGALHDQAPGYVGVAVVGTPRAVLNRRDGSRGIGHRRGDRALKRVTVGGMDALEPPRAVADLFRRVAEDGLHRFRPLDPAARDVPVVDDVARRARDEPIAFVAARQLVRHDALPLRCADEQMQTRGDDREAEHRYQRIRRERTVLDVAVRIPERRRADPRDGERHDEQPELPSRHEERSELESREEEGDGIRRHRRHCRDHQHQRRVDGPPEDRKTAAPIAVDPPRAKRRRRGGLDPTQHGREVGVDQEQNDVEKRQPGGKPDRHEPKAGQRLVRKSREAKYRSGHTVYEDERVGRG